MLRLPIALALALAAIASSAPALAEPPPLAPAPAPATPPLPATVTTPTTSATPQPPATPPPPPLFSEMPSWLKYISIGAGTILWYYQPLAGDVSKSNASVFWANLLVDAKYKRWGLHLEPRFRDTKLRPFFDGPAWLQEAYAYVTLGSTTIKAGKIYSHLGYFWDGSFYGNVQVYDGLKLDPDYGISVEGTPFADRRVGFSFWAQYFLVDGSTNVSLPGRDTISIAGARRRHQVIGRIEPFVHIRDNVDLRVGASGEFLEAADLPVIGTQNVGRFAGDFQLVVGPWLLWGEYTRQEGRTVTDFPIAPPAAAITSAAGTTAPAIGQSSAHIDYYWIGTQLSWRRLTARYAFSLGDYNDVNVREWLHLPSLGVQINPYLSVLAEFVWWERSAPTGHSFVDRSLDVTLYAHF